LFHKPYTPEQLVSAVIGGKPNGPAMKCEACGFGSIDVGGIFSRAIATVARSANLE
jgi:hypothetical protein